MCDVCDRRHGDELQLQVMALVRAGQITPGRALARMLLDDAHLAGMLEVRTFVDSAVTGGIEVLPWIPVAVPRWRVIVGRALALGELPEIALLVQVTLARFMGLYSTPGVLAELKRDLSDAMSTVDPNVLDVEVTTEMGRIDPGHLKIIVTTRTAAGPGMVAVAPGAEDVEIPADILRRPRGQA